MAKKFSNSFDTKASTPLVFWEEGQVVTGELGEVRQIKTKFGPAKFIHMVLTEKLSSKDKEGKPVTHKPGDQILLSLPGFLASVQTMPEATEVQITCTGKEPSDKGNDAWTFDVKY